jgi:hypothetical protein
MVVIPPLKESLRSLFRHHGRIFAVEELLPLKDRFGFAAGAGVRFTVLGKCGLGKDSERVMERFLNDCTLYLGVNETMAAFGALQHPEGHWRRTTHAVTANEPDAPKRKVAPKQASHNTQHPVGAMCILSHIETLLFGTL